MGATGFVGVKGSRGEAGDQGEDGSNVPGATGSTGATGQPGMHDINHHKCHINRYFSNLLLMNSLDHYIENRFTWEKLEARLIRIHPAKSSQSLVHVCEEMLTFLF